MKEDLGSGLVGSKGSVVKLPRWLRAPVGLAELAAASTDVAATRDDAVSLDESDGTMRADVLLHLLDPRIGPNLSRWRLQP